MESKIYFHNSRRYLIFCHFTYLFGDRPRCAFWAVLDWKINMSRKEYKIQPVSSIITLFWRYLLLSSILMAFLVIIHCNVLYTWMILDKILFHRWLILYGDKGNIQNKSDFLVVPFLRPLFITFRPLISAIFSLFLYPLLP